MLVARILRASGKGTMLRTAKRNLHITLLPTDKSGIFVQRILRDKKISDRATTLSIHSSVEERQDDSRQSDSSCEIEEDEDPRWRMCGLVGVELHPQVPNAFKRALGQIGRFQNLSRVELVHDNWVSQVAPSTIRAFQI